MYGKVFLSMYDGSLAGNWKALVTFQQFLVLKDADGIVDMTPEAIAQRTSIPLEIITEGISELEKPDPSSRTDDMEGRRIALLDDHRNWGWFVVNHDKYRNMLSAEDRRAYWRERKRAQRERVSGTVSDSPGKSKTVSECPPMSTHTDIDTNTNTKTGRGRGAVAPARKKSPKRSRVVPDDWRPTAADIKWLEAEGYACKADWVRRETEKFLDHEYDKPKSDWSKAYRNWLRKAPEFSRQTRPKVDPNVRF